MAISGTNGSSRFGSINIEHIYVKMLDTVRAGLQLSFRVLRQINPFSLIFGWYIFVLKVIKGARKGCSTGNSISRTNLPPKYGELSGPLIIAYQNKG